MASTRNLDAKISGWILEFLLRHQISDLLVNKIVTDINFPIADDNPRLKKTLILRSIDSEIRDGSVSETMLESLEVLEKLDRGEGIKVSNLMKEAYRTVAVECTVKYLGGSPSRSGGRYFEAVERIWRGRVQKLEKVGESELFTEELRECRDQIEAAIWDSSVCKRFMERNSRNEALKLVKAYLCEAMALMGPSFLKAVARKEKEAKEKAVTVADGDAGDQNAGGADKPTTKKTQKKKVLHKQKEIASHRRHKGKAKIVDCEEQDVDRPCNSYQTLQSTEVDKMQESLRRSSMELQAVVKDPLPEALRLVEALIAEMARKAFNQENSVQSRDIKDASTSFSVVISEVAKKIINQDSSLQNLSVKGVSVPNLSNNETVEHVQTEANNEMPSCSNQNELPKLSLMERNSTARAYEWDDSIDDSPDEGARNHVSRVHLETPKRKAVSPLKKYELMKFARRRKMKRWSLEEEDALREGVKKFGKGNWKLILNSRRDIFAERTEVDLKDKWRNMTRF
ncbi:hypothetical protein K2173_016543 [Erythroxylum novogranatense]|uniref:Uncharacterized protein n=1 Tax=Erythroxylum novogranatense TaxID=1862640 RepID=A0AAV8SHD6_9ROSI|nr:hypothetical protein K2173_016543 [Erythroxylum novogranatense]